MKSHAFTVFWILIWVSFFAFTFWHKFKIWKKWVPVEGLIETYDGYFNGEPKRQIRVQSGEYKNSLLTLVLNESSELSRLPVGSKINVSINPQNVSISAPSLTNRDMLQILTWHLVLGILPLVSVIYLDFFK